MKKKILGICICTLLIATAVPAVTSLKNSKIIATVPSISQLSKGTVWIEEQKLITSDGEAFDGFGSQGDLDGDTLLVGAVNDEGGKGAVFVFIRTGNTWTEQAKLVASDGAEGDWFCSFIALDGDIALIGAANDDDNGVNAGSAYVFTRSGAIWTQQAKLLASDGAAGDQFGWSVDIDGDTAFIGAWGDDNYAYNSGSVYVFTYNGTNWTQQAKLFAADAAEGDWFGGSVILDGDLALIGADFDDDNGQNSGSAYVFTRSGAIWTQQAKLLASDGAAMDQFGYSIDFDNDTALISAFGNDDNGVDSGSAYIFVYNGTNWTQQAKLLASDGAEEDRFSQYAVALDGNTAFIPAPGDDDNGRNSGSAYVFTRNNTIWTEQQKLLASDGAEGDGFGPCRLDGNTAVLAAWTDDNENGINAGSAYVFVNFELPVADFSWTPQDPTINQSITFNASTSHDPDGNITLYEWDWNNDSIYDEAQTTPTTIHTWTSAGTYPVTLRVTDDYNLTGTITKTVHVNDTFTINITGGFGIKATITNIGILPATNIQWTFTLTGGLILLGKTKNGTVSSLAAGASATARDRFIVGFGKTTIKLDVTCAEGASATKTATGTVFLFFVFGVK